MDIYKQTTTTSIYSTYSKNVSEALINKRGETLEATTSTSSNAGSSATNLDINNIDIKSSLMTFLNSMGKLPTSENMDILDFLMNKNMSLSNETFKALEDSSKLFSGNSSTSMEKASFLLKNEMLVTQNNATQLDGITSKQLMIQSQINDLLKEMLGSQNISEILLKATGEKGIDTLIKDILLNMQNLKNEILSSENLEQLLDNLLNTDGLSKDASQLLEKLGQNEGEFSKLLDMLIPDELIVDSNLLMMVQNSNGNDVSLSDTSLDNLLKALLPNLLKNSGFGDMQSQINKADYSELQQKLSDFIKNSPELNKLFDGLFSNISKFQNILNNKFSLNPSKATSEDVEKLFQNLKQLTNSIKNANSEQSSNMDSILKNASNIDKNIDFLAQLKDSFYLQIPLFINNFHTNGEIFIFKDKNNKKSNSKKQSASALVSVELLNLGQIEIYVSKVGEEINFQFKLGEEFVEDLIKSNYELLERYMKEKNMKLTEVSFSKLEEPFTLTSDESEFEEKTNISAEV